MRSIYRYTLSFDPAALPSEGLDKFRDMLSQMSYLTLSSKEFDAFSNCITSAIELLGQVISNSSDSEHVITPIHANPLFKSITQFLNNDVLASAGDIESFELDKVPFDPGEILRVWMFNMAGAEYDNDGVMLSDFDVSNAAGFLSLQVTTTNSPAPVVH